MSRLKQWVAKSSRNSQDMEDLVQETLVVAVARSGLTNYTLPSFLYKVLKNKVLKQTYINKREESRRVRLEESTLVSNGSDLLSAYERKELEKALYEAVSTLSDEEKRLFYLIVKCSSREEICESLNIKFDALRKRKQRLENKLREILSRKPNKPGYTKGFYER